MITRTHNAYHLGDNLVHLHFLRKVALDNLDRQFVHYCDYRYLQTKSIYRVTDVVSDIPNIKLEPIGYSLPAGSIDSWRGANGFWYQHSDRNDFVKFHVEHWFPHLAYMMDVRNPIRKGADMLFDYPAIKSKTSPEFDVLIINSPPSSGQFQGYSETAFDAIRTRMVRKGLEVAVSWPTTGTSVTQFGNLSLHCHTILMVSTGPSWPTFNIWNQESVKNRIILLDSERVWLSPNTIHCQRVEEAAEILKESGLL